MLPSMNSEVIIIFMKNLRLHNVNMIEIETKREGGKTQNLVLFCVHALPYKVQTVISLFRFNILFC